MKILSTTNRFSIFCLSLLAVACTPDNSQTSSVNGNQESDAAPTSSTLNSNVDKSSVAVLKLSNPSSFARKDEGVYLSFYELGIEYDGDYYLAKTDANILPTNVIDKDGDGEKDGIYFILDIDSEQKISLQIEQASEAPQLEKRTQAEISHKVDGEWNEQVYEGGTFENVRQLATPPQYTDHSEWIRYEGPGIESDLVGYRVYLDWRNGFDIFGKTKAPMALQDIGQDGYDSYHEPSDWGMDLLKVGDALGVGGYGYWDGEKAIRVSDVDTWAVEIPNNNELQSSFKINYGNWQPSDELTTNLSAHLTMHAGQRWIEVDVTSSEKLPNLLAGVVRHPNTEVVQGDMNITGKAWTYLGTYGAQSLDEGQLGMAVLVQKGSIKEVVSDSLNEVVVLNPTQLPPSDSQSGEEKNAQKIHYYLVAAWDKEPNSIVDTKADFELYLKQAAERLTLPLRVSIQSRFSTSLIPSALEQGTPLSIAAQLVESELARKPTLYAFNGFDVERSRSAFFEYTTGLLMQSFSALSEATGENKYRAAAHKTIASFIEDDGKINAYKLENYNIDSINTGRMVLQLHQETKESQYKTAADTLRQQLDQHPRTSEGAFWHKKRYPYQLWLDGVYMGMPFLAEYISLYDEEPDYSEIINEFTLVKKHLRDEETGLFFHAWDEKKQQEWADKESGLSKHFWGRGVGWYAMALVDVLDYIPESAIEERQVLLSQITELAETLVLYQDSQSNTWYQILDTPAAPGNYLESSASSMFTYFLSKALNKGYLPEEYRDSTLAAYQGLLNQFIEFHNDDTISLTGTCSVAGLGFGRDGSYRYYMSEQIVKNDPKAVGPFILASIEMHSLLANTTKSEG